MNSKKRVFKNIATVCIMTFLLLTGITTKAMAGPKDHQMSGFKHIPKGSQRISYRDTHYVVHQGRFYRPFRSGYEYIRPPAGVVVSWLPAAAFVMLAAGMTYYMHENVYYRKIPTGYQVVEVPPVAETRVIQVQPLISSAPGTRLMVMVDMLNVRTGPGLEHAIKFQVYYGNMVTAKGNAPDWIYIQMPDNRDGWVMNQYVSIPAAGSKG